MSDEKMRDDKILLLNGDFFLHTIIRLLESQIILLEYEFGIRRGEEELGL